MKKIKNWLLDDWWLKLLSLALAFIIWFFVVQTTNPTSERGFSNIHVTLKNAEFLDSDNKVYEVLENTDITRVVVRAPKSVLTNLTSSDIVAVADVANMVDGVIPIEYDIVTNGNGTAESVKGSQEYLKLAIEDRVRKYVSIAHFTTGEVDDGYLYNGVKLDQNMIEISGPASSIEGISYAGVSINVANANSSISALMDVILYDSNNNPVNDSKITKQVDQVRVDVEILELKKVPIYVTKMGIPKEGFLFSGNLKPNYESITIAGPHDELAKIAQIIFTEPVDITDADSDVTAIYDLAMYLPEGVIFAEDGFDGVVTVTAGIEPASVDSYSIPVSDIVVKNAPDGYDITVSSIIDAVKVNISGLRTELDQLSVSGIVAFIDVDAWMKEMELDMLEDGKYSIPIQYMLPGSLEGEKDVYVTIIVTAKK